MKKGIILLMKREILGVCSWWESIWGSLYRSSRIVDGKYKDSEKMLCNTPIPVEYRKHKVNLSPKSLTRNSCLFFHFFLWIGSSFPTSLTGYLVGHSFYGRTIGCSCIYGPSLLLLRPTNGALGWVEGCTLMNGCDNAHWIKIKSYCIHSLSSLLKQCNYKLFSFIPSNKYSQFEDIIQICDMHY